MGGGEKDMGGHGEGENLALIPGKPLFSVLWDMKAGARSQEGTREQDSALVESTAVYHRGLELLFLLEGRWTHVADGRTSCISHMRNLAQSASLLKPRTLPFCR